MLFFCTHYRSTGEEYCQTGMLLRAGGLFLDRSLSCFVICTQPDAWNASRLPSRMLTLPTPPALSGPSPGCVPSDLSSVRPVCPVTVSVHFMP
jgi:hypothetical protein